MATDDTEPRPILIAYDGSAQAGAAVRAAAALFGGAAAVVACARTDPAGLAHSAALARPAVPDDMIAGGVAALERAVVAEAEATAAEGARIAAEAGLDAQPAVAIAPGAPWRAIRDLAKEHDARLVACGTRGQGTFSRATLGSTSTALLHHLDRPVLVVPGGGGDLRGPLVIGYDGSDGAAAAIEGTAALFPGREALVVHVWESAVRHTLSGRVLGALPLEELRAVTSDFDGYLQDAARALAEQGGDLARAAGLAATAREQEAKGIEWHGLLAAADAAGAALVAVGSRGRGALASAVLGSVSAGLAHNADVPVLVVPAADG